MGFLTGEDRDFVRDLKEVGVLEIYSENDLKNITRNGGAASFCGDGDIDVRNYHERTITGRPHSQSLFGGPLIYSPLYRGYKESFAIDSLENMREGMGAKETQRVFLYPHYPCGMATKYNHSIREVVLMAAGVHIRFISEFGFLPGKVHSFFHVKRFNRGEKEEQNTYIFNVKKYLPLIGNRIISLNQIKCLRRAA